MDLIWQKFTDWLKEILIGGIKDALSGLFDTVNTRVGEIAGQVGATPQGWNGGIYNMIRSLSDNVILPIAGVILAIVMTMELIQIITDKNNMHGEVDTWFSAESLGVFVLFVFGQHICGSCGPMKKALAVEGLGSPARPDVKNRLLQRFVGSQSRGQSF